MHGDFGERVAAVGGLADGPLVALEGDAHLAAGVGIVVDDEDVAVGLAELLHGGAEGVPADGLGDVVGGAEGGGQAVVVDEGDHDDGDVGEVGVGLEGAQDGPAIDAGHGDVEQDGARMQELAGQFDADRAVGGGVRGEAFALAGSGS